MKNLLSLVIALLLCLGLALPAAAVDTSVMGQFTAISCGDDDNMAAIDANGSLWTWGNNHSGTLGNGTKDQRSLVPVKVMENVSSVSCGFDFVAAIKEDGSLWTWGHNGLGQLGDGTTTQSITPIKVMEDVAAVHCNGQTTYVIKTDHTLWTWGNPRVYEEDGSPYFDKTGKLASYQSAPLLVMENVATVCGNGSVTAVIRTDGTLWMWGNNQYGQVGNGGEANVVRNDVGKMQTIPVKVLDYVKAVSIGGNTVAAITVDSSLWMWGLNNEGQIPNGGAANCPDPSRAYQSVPLKVMDGVKYVSLGTTSAIVKTDGSLWMWGNNRFGQLGNGTIATAAEEPVKILDNVAAVSLGDTWTAALKTDGTLWTWGESRRGQLGNGGTGNFSYSYSPSEFYQTVPAQIMTGIAVPDSAIKAVAGFYDVYEGNYYADAVVWAKETGVTGGTSATTFSPGSTVTRAQAVTFLWRAAGSPQPAAATSPFTDVTDTGAYYYDAVLWATEQGITGGVGNNRFSVDGTLTYDQMLAMLCRASGDTATGDNWSAAAVAWAKEHGLTDGLNFGAKNSCPRSDVVYCLWKQLA